MALDLGKLNKEQKEAVAHKERPLLIVAGAGTGKTTVITQRIVNLVEKGLAKPEEILAVTFTEKAASEMEERVDRLLEFGYMDLWISTFHAFCERVLRDNALDIGLPLDFKILDQTSGWLLARQNLEKFELDYYKSLGNPAKFIQFLISHFSHCKDQEIYPQDYLDYADKLKNNLTDLEEKQGSERIKEVANAYHIYQKILLDNNSLDFGDLINYCLKLFKKRPLILKKYREKFKYILVDEFQDTNWSQYELIKILAEPKNNLTVCADDDQAIYRWRGASFSNIMLFKKDFPDAKQISLVRNYRSCQNILDQSYKFIKANNPDRLESQIKISKKLVADTDEEGIVLHLAQKSLDEEVGAVIRKIIELKKKDKSASFNDFAILARANDTAIPFIKALERFGLPYQFLASRGLYSKPIILDVISYFKLLDNYHESSAMYRILNLPFIGISDEDIMKLTLWSHKKTRSLYETLQESALITGLSKGVPEKIIFILTMIKKHSLMAREKSVSEIYSAFLEDFGYLKFLVDKEDQDKVDILNQFLKRVKKFEEATIEPTLKKFMEEINMELESGEQGKLEFDPNIGPEMIKVMTIHGAKGLEFKYVFLVSMVDRRFPTIERRDPIELPAELIKDMKPAGDAHLQEERRICYVAMTRAKKGLFFTSGQDYGGVQKKKLSRFLVEMGYKDSGKSAGGGGESTQEKLKKPEFELSKGVKPEYLPEHFSFSQLAAFEKCPYQYKLSFILKVPARGKAVFSFGKTIHNTLNEFLKEANEASAAKQDNLFGFKKDQEKAAKENKNILLKRLYDIYDKNWIDEWYADKKNKEEYYKDGKRILKQFFDDFSKNPPKILKINGNLALEIPFNLKIGDYKLFGVIDRIDETDSGARILDYKTGSPKKKLEAGDKSQLLIYQIAAEEIFKIKPEELVYHYLEDGSFVSFLGADKEKQDRKEKILSQIEKIKKGNFQATPGRQCQHCDFKDICNHAERG